MKSLAKKAILQTIVYSDIFDFPLKEEEIFLYLTSDVISSQEDIKKEIKKISKIIYKDGYYCLKGREEIIKKRKNRKKEAVKKFLYVWRAKKVLSVIPTIKFIGISGGLAMENVEPEDDIDLFIIVSGKTVWVTRFLATIFLQALGLRRKRNEQNAGNKICLNMFLSDSSLKLPKEKRSLYTAHEIVQLKSLLNKSQTHERFLQENNWIRLFLPHVAPQQVIQSQKKSVVALILYIVEPLFKWIQYKYMESHISLETVSDVSLFFHPIDYRVKIMEEYKRRCRKYGAL